MDMEHWKAMGRWISGLLAVALLAASLPGLSLAKAPPECGSDYVVRPGDTLYKIAAQHYGDGSLYPAIVLATNAVSAGDSSYATIVDPWLIRPDWKLCLPTLQAAQAGLTAGALKNAEYLTEFTASGKAALSDGKYEESAAPGSATKTVIMLSDRLAFGSTAEGNDLAAVLLIANPGGSGTFYYLSAVVRQDGKPVNVATTLLGDRVKINSLAIVGQEMVVDMVTAGPTDPLCCPTQRVVHKYVLRGDKLIQTSSEAKPGAAIALEGVMWKLDGYLNNQGQYVNALPDAEVTLKMEGGQVSGRAGCNQYSGPYEVSGNQLTFGLFGATQMYCVPEALMDQEGAFLTALGSAASYQIADTRLLIADAAGKAVLTFSLFEPAPLTKTTWRLNGYFDGKSSFVSVLADTEITAIFDAGQASGSAGCNNYSGSYDLKDKAITFGALATTRKMCSDPAGIMEQENAYLAALGSATTWQTEGSELALSKADGVRVASFTASQG
jgi:heat shock protein HslJ